MKRLFNNTLRCLGFAALMTWGSMTSTAWGQNYKSETDNYSRVNLSLQIAEPYYTGHGVAAVSNHDLYGLSLGYVYGINVAGRSLPLFLEVGPEMSFVRRSEEIDYWDHHTLIMSDEIDTRMLSVSTPINMAYQIRLTNAIWLLPSAGLTAKVNLLAETSGDGKDINLFDEGANRFQLGWNAGCSISFARFCLSLRYASDITPFMSEGKHKERYQTLSCGVGLRF